MIETNGDVDGFIDLWLTIYGLHVGLMVEVRSTASDIEQIWPDN